MTVSSKSAWAEINLARLCHNLKAIWKGRPSRQLIAVVKADAYGHGAVEVARRLAAEGVTMLAVANVAEAAELRSAGIATPILLLGAYTRMECEDILHLDLATSVSSVAFAEDLDRAASRRKTKARIHVKIDTGMSRLGIPCARAVESVERLSVLSNLALEGLYTHFAASDEEDKTFTMRQVCELNRVISVLEGMGIRFQYIHAAATAACMEVPEAHFNALRPGIALYGLHPASCCGTAMKLKPIMEFASRVVHVERHGAGATIGYGRTHHLDKDTAVAVISAGYADGYDRRFSGKAVVTIGGAHAPVLGRVSMDLTSVDVSHVPGVKPGDKAVLFSSDPKAPNSVENLARLIDTIPYTLTCGVSRRVERAYTD
jgi:alanine racemase